MYSSFIKNPVQVGVIVKFFPKGGALAKGEGKTFFLQGIWDKPEEKAKIIFFKNKLKKNDKGWYLDVYSWVLERDFLKFKGEVLERQKEEKKRARKEKVKPILEKNRDWVIEKYWPRFKEEIYSLFEQSQNLYLYDEEWTQEDVVVVEMIKNYESKNMKKILYFNSLFLLSQLSDFPIFSFKNMDFEIKKEVSGICIYRTRRRPFTDEEKTEIKSFFNDPVVKVIVKRGLTLNHINGYFSSNKTARFILKVIGFEAWKMEIKRSFLGEKVELLKNIQNNFGYDLTKRPLEISTYTRHHESKIRLGYTISNHMDIYFYGKLVESVTFTGYSDAHSEYELYTKEQVDSYVANEIEGLKKELSVIKEILGYF